VPARRTTYHHGNLREALISAALDLYIDLLKRCGPPNYATLGQGDVIQLLATGKAPMGDVVTAAFASFEDPSKSAVVGKLENFNPLWSVKDRIGVSMIDAAERAGLIGPDTISASGRTSMYTPGRINSAMSHSPLLCLQVIRCRPGVLESVAHLSN
jgi:hypothetical protein